MGMNQQDRDNLTNNWDQASQQIRAKYPQLTDDDLKNGQSDPDSLVASISQRTGESEDSVRQTLQQVAQSSSTSR